ncbi:MAG: DUF1667 domain-containing protein [Clostridia bacterium]|nr:DUF1667 domain-containing protein [Clostridia bacterium]
MKRELTCIICPKGCTLLAEVNGEAVSVSGNDCPRGAEYAKNECVNPVRTVTSTVRTKSGVLVPVKTKKPIPKNRMEECMKIINSLSPDLPICVGDVIMEDVFGSALVATQNAIENYN